MEENRWIMLWNFETQIHSLIPTGVSQFLKRISVPPIVRLEAEEYIQLSSNQHKSAWDLIQNDPFKSKLQPDSKEVLMV